MPKGKAVNLIAEEALIAELSPLWQRRFQKATELLELNLAQPFDWKPIAQQCAVSPNHFHTLFKQIYGETPAQYHRRLRLKKVVYELFFKPEKSVTDIALDCGFSTSQALAKVLKRLLGKTAAELRSGEIMSHYEEIQDALELPRSEFKTSMEAGLNHKMDFQLSQRDALYLRIAPANSAKASEVISFWRKMAPTGAQHAYCVSPWQGAEDLLTDFQIGYETEAGQANFVLPAQQVLSSRVKINDVSTYMTAWYSLHLHALQLGLEVCEDYGFIDLIHNARDYQALYSDITMILPVTSENAAAR